MFKKIFLFIIILLLFLVIVLAWLIIPRNIIDYNYKSKLVQKNTAINFDSLLLFSGFINEYDKLNMSSIVDTYIDKAAIANPFLLEEYKSEAVKINKSLKSYLIENVDKNDILRYLLDEKVKSLPYSNEQSKLNITTSQEDLKTFINVEGYLIYGSFESTGFKGNETKELTLKSTVTGLDCLVLNNGEKNIVILGIKAKEDRDSKIVKKFNLRCDFSELNPGKYYVDYYKRSTEGELKDKPENYWLSTFEVK